VNSSYPDSTRREDLAEPLPRKENDLRQLLALYSRERRLIVYDLHDGLAQYLSGAMLHLQAYFTSQDGNSQTGGESWKKGLDFITRGITELRKVMQGLQSGIRDENGIMESLAVLVEMHRKDYGVDIKFRHVMRCKSLAPPLKNAVFRILQESLGNACRHSRSKMIQVQIVQRGVRMHLEVRDWGIGFNLNNVEKDRNGLLGIRQRAELLGGQAAIKSAPGAGTRIYVELPVVEADSIENLSEDGVPGVDSASILA
jgi:two-component system sensor histidine kinase DegS